MTALLCFTEVIMERAAEARENDQEAKLKKKQQARAKSMEEWKTLEDIGSESRGRVMGCHGMSWVKFGDMM